MRLFTLKILSSLSLNIFGQKFFHLSSEIPVTVATFCILQGRNIVTCFKRYNDGDQYRVRLLIKGQFISLFVIRQWETHYLSEVQCMKNENINMYVCCVNCTILGLFWEELGKSKCINLIGRIWYQIQSFPISFRTDQTASNVFYVVNLRMYH